MTLTAHVAIGNSDDKLTQRQWSEFVACVDQVARSCGDLYGSWDSAPASSWQNHCVAFAVPEVRLDGLREALRDLATEYHQDAIALNVSLTEHIIPGWEPTP